jgi:hypothetical protein
MPDFTETFLRRKQEPSENAADRLSFFEICVNLQLIPYNVQKGGSRG